MQPIKLLNGHPFVPYKRETFDAETMVARSGSFYHWMDKRRSCRDFSCKPVPKEVIANILLAASTSPSGAHKQPWTFCVVSDPQLKTQIRRAAENEEEENYQNRMGEEWLRDLAPLATDWHKPFLETAPYLIVVFRRSYEFDEEAVKHQNYYVQESCGIACGMLLTAIHNAGLVALTHTPSPMNFLVRILQRPENEKPFLLIPLGYPLEDCWVPDLKRKSLNDIAVWY